MKAKAKRKAKRSTIKNKADRVFSLYIRARDGSCKNCGRPDNLQAAHIVSRRYHGTRWDEENCVALCRDCHVFYTHRPLEWSVWVDENGPVKWEDMRRRALSTTKPDYEVIVAHYTERLKEVEG